MPNNCSNSNQELKMSSVEVIINALAELEKDIDNLNLKIEEMKKRMMIYSNEQIENLKQQTISIANEEAKKIIDIAKKEFSKRKSKERRIKVKTVHNNDGNLPLSCG